MSDTKGTAIARRDFTLLPASLGEAREMAEMIAHSDFAPKDYKGKPNNVIIAVQMGADLGLKPMQALQNIAVINGRPSVWGDGALALAMPALESFKEWFEGEGDDLTAHCRLRRRGWPDDTMQSFSVKEAKAAGLWGKAGPWTTYPKRMLQMRARSWALRDACSDLLMGLVLAEEAGDYPELSATGVTDEPAPKAIDRMEQVPEGLRDNLTKAFDTLNLAPGLRLAKLNEFLGKDGVTPEEGAQALLDWCKDEYALRKTGQPRKRTAGDNKVQAKA